MSLKTSKMTRKNLALLTLAFAMCNLMVSAANAKLQQGANVAEIQSILGRYATDTNNDDEDPLRTQDPKNRSQALVTLGWEFLKAGDRRTALKRFLLATKMDETNASAYFGAAYVCSVENALDEAITLYRIALTYDNKSAKTYSNLAKALLLKDMFSNEAPKLLDMAIQIDPNDPETYVTYSRYFADKDDWNAAGAKMNQAIALGREVESGTIKDFKKHGIQLNQPPQRSAP
ncbi:MAG: hypothetical protein JST89_18670 [Cyanobacteria bacterium SZAS-4]|nr:hypothetical protein [Cyanobacteria bacterium SZAS-4]